MSRAASIGRVGSSRRFAICLSLLVLATTIGAQQPASPPETPAGRRPRAERVLHQSPPGCSQNALTIDIARNPADPVIINGTVVTYTVRAFNLPIGGGLPCDATAVSISFTCPGPDGNPTGTTTVLSTNDSLPAGSSKSYPPIMCTVTVNPGVTKATAQGSFSGTIHTTDPDDFAMGTKTVTVNIIQPTPTPTPTNTSTFTPTLTPTITLTPTSTPTSNTPTFTNTAAATGTPTITPTATSTSTPLPTTATPTFTATPVPPTPTATPTISGGPPGGQAVPTLSPTMLGLLALALLAVALIAIRRS